MAYTDMHFLAAFGGTLYSGAETWSVGLRLFATTGMTSPVAITYAEANMAAVANAVSTQYALWNMCGTTTKLTWCKFNAIGTDGLYVDSGLTNVVYYTAPGIAGSGTASLPPQCAVVASLRTAADRGRAHAGRAFIPALALSVDATGRLSDTARDNTSVHFRNLVNALNTLPDAPTFGPVSVTVASKIGAGTKHLVTGVRVGNVIDTHRSRRAQMSEAYSTTSPVTP